MTWFEAVVLGVIQGLTEFLPISSSAHLRIAGEFLGDGSDPGAAFTAITQLGTEAAVLVYFRHDISRIVRAWLSAVVGNGSHSDPDARMGWLVIVGTLPIAVAGLAFQDLIEDELRTLWLTASMLILFALVIGFADATARNERTLDRLTWKHGVLFGLAQALALVPGVSRSGGTIAAGLLMGYTREAAARYSFLLAVPAVLAAGFFQLAKSFGEPAGAGAGPTALATGISFAVGYVVIVAFLRFVSTRSYLVFVVYRIVLGAVLLALLAAGVVSA